VTTPTEANNTNTGKQHQHRETTPTQGNEALQQRSEIIAALLLIELLGDCAFVGVISPSLVLSPTTCTAPVQLLVTIPTEALSHYFESQVRSLISSFPEFLPSLVLSPTICTALVQLLVTTPTEA